MDPIPPPGRYWQLVLGPGLLLATAAKFALSAATGVTPSPFVAVVGLVLFVVGLGLCADIYARR